MEPFYPLRALVCAQLLPRPARGRSRRREPHLPRRLRVLLLVLDARGSSTAAATSRQMTERLGLGAAQPGRRARLQRRLPAAVLQASAASRCSASSRRPTRPRSRSRRGSRRASSSSACETARASPPSAQADLLLGNNVLAHVPDINDFVAGMKIAAEARRRDHDGVPAPAASSIELNQWDTIYHEHFSYLSFATVAARLRGARPAALRRRGAADARRLAADLRLPRRRRREPRRDRGARAARARARGGPASDVETYLDFGAPRRRGQAPDPRRSSSSSSAQGKSIAGYGAPAKGNTLLNYCGVGRDFLDFTVRRATRTSRATSCPARTSRSSRPTRSRERPARRRADPAVEHQGRDHASSCRTSASGAGASPRARRSCGCCR